MIEHHFKLKFKEYEEYFDPNEITFTCGLQVLDKESKLVHEIFKVPVAIEELLAWLEENHEALTSEDYLFTSQKENLCAAIRKFYDDIPDGDSELSESEDAALDNLYNYRVRHCLYFGMRGMDIPDVYIGMYKGRSEVSFVLKNNDSVSFPAYDIDIGSFVNDTITLFKSLKAKSKFVRPNYSSISKNSVQ